ncbi:MAG: MerR family transcriptional regulator [Lachnospiraceae bacterium]|nr:MerR family transcriptional regulator [Lachnospiraceae bacterium]
MKISELSKLSHVHPETIRMYRKLGLLTPTQNPLNLYYDYSDKDLMSLLFIRKLRGSGLSLDAISYTYEHADPGDLNADYQRELDQVNTEIEKLQKKKYMLQITMDHLEQYKENLSGISVIEVLADRIDAYESPASQEPAMHKWIDNIEFFTQSLLIRKEVLLQKELPEQVPVRLGLGSYRFIFDSENLPLPENVVICPKGTYVTTSVELTNLHSIDRAQLLPMLDYIQGHGYIIDSDTTAFLFRIQPTPDGCKFIYRMRVKVLRSSALSLSE